MPKPPITEPLDLKSIWDSGRTYNSWIETTQPEQQSKLNEAFNCIEVQAATTAFLSNIKRKVYILGIAEDWCGDVIRNTPIVAKLEQNCPNLKLKIVSREVNLIVRYLTNGAEGIPKFIFLTDQWIEIGNWGPRPEALKTLMARAKSLGAPSDAYPRIRAFYQSDKSQTAIKELCTLISIASCETL